jgi:hypothetical protein
VGKPGLLFVADSGAPPGRFSWGFHEPQDGVSGGTFPLAAYAPLEIAGGRLQVHR